MASSHDVAFGHAAVKQRLLTSEQVNLGTKIQKVLGEISVAKPLAVIAVEAGWLELDAAMTIVTGLRKLGIDHPEVRPRPSSDADEAVLERVSPAARKRLEAASRNLAALFYARSAGSLALDQGSPTPLPRTPRPPADPAPVRRVKAPAVETIPPKSSALGAILAVAAAVIAIVAYLVTRKGAPPPPPEPEPPPIVKKTAPKPPPPAPPAPVPPKTTDDAEAETRVEPAVDPAVEARRKEYIAKQEGVAAGLFEEAKALLKESRPASARSKLRELVSGFSWTEFVKTRKDEIARLTKEAEEAGFAEVEEPDSMPTMEEPLPVMTAAVRRIDDEAAADARRASIAKTKLAGWKSDLALRGGKVVKGAEVLDVSREDLRVRGEIDGTKVDLLLAWAALDAPSFVAVQKQIVRGQGAAGPFEMGRLAVQGRLWKEARAAFDECAKIDAAWKTRLPDLAAILSDPAILRSGRRLGDGRLLVDYTAADPEQAGEFKPVKASGSALTMAGPSIKFACKEETVWTLREVAFEDDIEVWMQFEGPGEIAVGVESDPAAPSRFYVGPGGLRHGEKKIGPCDPARPFCVKRRGPVYAVVQAGRELFTLTDGGGKGPWRVTIGATSDSAIRNLWIVGRAPGEMARRIGPLERLEGGARFGDFQLEAAPLDSETKARADLVEAALDAGLLEDAWNRSEEAISRTPMGSLATACRGLVRLAQGEIRLAVADADLAMALDPCRGEVAIRARRITAAIRGAAGAGAFRRKEAGPWEIVTDVSEARLTQLAAALEEAGKRYAEALQESTPPKGVRVTVFSSLDAYFMYLETAVSREAVVLDAQGPDPELQSLAAAAYIRAAAPAAPGWFEVGMAAHLSGLRRAGKEDALAAGKPLDSLVRKSVGELTELERGQAESFVRFLLDGPHKAIIPDLLKKLRLGVPAMEVFSGRDLTKLDAEWKSWASSRKN